MDNIKKTVEEFNDCTSKIIGCAMRVHSTLGNGLQQLLSKEMAGVTENQFRLFCSSSKIQFMICDTYSNSTTPPICSSTNGYAIIGDFTNNNWFNIIIQVSVLNLNI